MTFGTGSSFSMEQSYPPAASCPKRLAFIGVYPREALA
jgi:hypothetical protein